MFVSTSTSSKLSIWQRFFEPSVPLPPIERSKVRLLISFLLALVVSGVTYEAAYNMVRPGEDGAAETAIVVIALLVAYFLAKQGYWKIAAVIAVMLPYLGILTVIITGNEPRNDLSIIPFMIIPLILSSIFFSIRSVGYVAIIFSAGMMLLIPITSSITFNDLLAGPLFLLWIITGIIQISSIHRAYVESQRQAALAQSETRFRQLAENIRDAFWNYDIEQKSISYISPACEQVLGLSAEDIYENPNSVINALHHEDRPKALSALQSITAGHSISIEIRIFHSNGNQHWVWIRGFPVLNPQNKIMNIAGIVSDITELKLAQQQLQEMNQTLENRVKDRTEELVIANASLAKAARMKDEFLAGMSHELRTPLTGILGLSEALRLQVYGEMNPRQLKTIETVEESGRHLLSLINDILDLSKIEAGKLELQIHPTSLDEICKSSIQMIKGMANQKNQHIHYFSPEDPVKIFADARRIKQVLVNLLSNAVKFTGNHGEIGLEVRPHEPMQKVMVTVWDKGIGIKPEDQHKLFKPFTQIDGSLAREYSGTGLGLSLAHRLTEAHNGSIEVESIFGEGSRFTITLPLADPVQPPNIELKEFSTTMNVKPLSFEVSQLPLVLVADDNPIVLQMLADYLESNQYRVLKVSNGVELLVQVAKHIPDILLVDIQMPRMDGLETIYRIRSDEDPQIASTPIIAVTALAMPGDRERCLQAGANEYISKPVELLELKRLVKKYIREN
jgi:PAS domain S-box-containing protein